MRVSATAKYLRGSTRKARLVDRRRSGQARRGGRRPAAVHAAVRRARTSRACSRARPRTPRTTTTWRPRTCVVLDAVADEGPTIKRLRPRAQGRAFPIHKPMTHITDHRRGPGGLTWDTRSIRTASASGVSRTWTAKWYARQGIHRPPQGGHRDPPARRQAPGQRQRQRRRDRARHQPGHGHRPHGQAGHRHRQGRRERRDPAPADRRAHQAQGQAGDQGDPPAGARRLPRRDQHRPAAEPPHRLQEGDEAGRSSAR